MVADEGQADEETDNSEPEFVEIDAANRYGRYSEVLGKGAFKTVYRAFDELEGIEVAWNQVKVKDVSRRPEDLEHLHSELHLLQTLKHKNIIKFYKSWVDPLNGNINFITELFTSGNLKQYRAKHKRVDMRAVKNWCRQILSGLQYLHNHDPPIIHRDLKCDNIFINGSFGEVKIGDLGLAAILKHSHLARSIIGTPEFMAPEFYEEEYNELVDIYAFGMCLLELVTFEYPYSECSNPAQIFQKVSAGIKPASLARVNNAEVRRFIEKCIANVSERLPARDLLMDTFLQSDTEKCHTEYLPPIDHSDKNSYQEDMKQSPTGASTSVTVKAQLKDIDKIFMKLRISDSRGYVRNIHFPFDIESDTSISVAREMVTELELTDQDVSAIAEMIDSEIKCHVPNLVPGNTLARHYADMPSIAENVEYEVENEIPGHLFSGFVLERLPSGRKYWSDSPKGSPTRTISSASSESNLRAGVRHSTEVHKMTNSHFGGSSREDYLDDGMQFKSCPDLASFVEREEDDFWREQLSSKGKLSETMIEGESENIKVIMEKLENLLAEQEKELKELKKRHEENIAVILKDIPPEHRKITLQRCWLNVVDNSLAAELDRYKVP